MPKMKIHHLQYILVYLATFFEYMMCDPGCPNFCTCKWKNGKQTVECMNRGLSEIPDNLDPATQVLDVSGNKLSILPNEIFVRKKMVNLQRIYLNRCLISSIEDAAFRDLTNLVELDLSENELETIPTAIFRDISSLMRLSLKQNRIKKLDKFAFNHLTYLNTLELTGCEISEIHEKSFEGLRSLEWLHLDGNRLTTIVGEKTIPNNLKGVILYNNPWECDCHISDFHAWLTHIKVPLSVDPVCVGPTRLEGKIIKSIPHPDLACLPDISPTTFYLELSEGKNVSLVCHVNAIPEAKVSWWFHGQMLQNNSAVAPGVHLIYYVEEGTENKRSELYLYNTNANDNGTFICNAENAAGRSQGNFTIKVILKKEPIVIIVSLKYEYLLAIVIAIGAVISLLIVIIFLLMLKCLRKRKSTPKSLPETLNLQEQEVTIKTIPQNNCGGNDISTMYSSKLNASTTSASSDNITTIQYAQCEPPPMYRQVSMSSVRSPLSLIRYQLEKNPDIIDGTNVIGFRENGDGEDGLIRRFSGSDHSSLTLRPNECPSNVFNVSCRTVDSDGYPSDYGLPRNPLRRTNENFYRTLPNNRMKYHTAANPAARFNREADFLSRSTQVATSYDNQFNHTDVRYTADGYPERLDSLSSSPPDSFKSESAVFKMSGAQHQDGDNVHRVVMMKQYGVGKRCASAQTDEDRRGGDKVDKADDFSAVNDRDDTLTASPDEGYGGEPSVV